MKSSQFYPLLLLSSVCVAIVGVAAASSSHQPSQQIAPSPKYLDASHGNLGFGVTLTHRDRDITADLTFDVWADAVDESIPRFAVSGRWEHGATSGEGDVILVNSKSYAVSFSPTSVTFASPLHWLVSGVDEGGRVLVESWTMTRPSVEEVTNQAGGVVGHRLFPSERQTVRRWFFDSTGSMEQITAVSEPYVRPDSRRYAMAVLADRRVVELFLTSAALGLHQEVFTQAMVPADTAERGYGTERGLLDLNSPEFVYLKRLEDNPDPSTTTYQLIHGVYGFGGALDREDLHLIDVGDDGSIDDVGVVVW
jgi:hypothetical protein